MVSNLALFCLATCLATFQKIGQLFPNHLVTLHPIHLLMIFIMLMEQCIFKIVNNSLNTNIYSYLETSGGKSFNLYINKAHF